MTDVLLYCAQQGIDCTAQDTLRNHRTGERYTSPFLRFTTFARALLSEAACTVYLDELRSDLIAAAGQSSPQYPDLLVSRGERWMAELLSRLLREMGMGYDYPVADPCTFLCSDGKGGIDVERSTRLLGTEAYRTKALPRFIVPGYYARGEKGKLVCLPRHGSNISAVALAILFGIGNIINLSHLAGIPIIPQSTSRGAPVIRVISHSELAELMRTEPTELTPKAIDMMRPSSTRPPINLRIRHPNDPPDAGTLVTYSREVRAEGSQVSGIGLGTYSYISVRSSSLDVPGHVATTGATFKKLDTNVLHYIGSPISFTFVYATDASRNAIIERVFRERYPTADVEVGDCAVVCIVGIDLDNAPGIATRFYGALAQKGVNVLRALSGDRNMLAVMVAPDERDLAAVALYYEFFSLPSESLRAA
jgi:aspartokinase